MEVVFFGLGELKVRELEGTMRDLMSIVRELESAMRDLMSIVRELEGRVRELEILVYFHINWAF